MEFILFNITFTCVIVIACNLYVLETNALSLATIVALVDMISIVGLTFTYSFWSDWITINLMDIGDIFYQSAWYRLPVKQQKRLVLPIQRAQRLICLRCLGLFDCSLPVFLSVG